jgi:type 2A phosphatase activator TIP41
MSANVKFVLKEKDGGIDINGWSLFSNKAPISSSAQIEQIDKAIGVRSPEMPYFDNHLTIEHRASGLRIRFCAEDALKCCLRKQDSGENKSEQSSTVNANASVQMLSKQETGVSVQKGSVQVSMAKHWGNQAVSDAKSLDLPYDWTYTSDYKGTIASSTITATSQPTTQPELNASLTSLSISESNTNTSSTSTINLNPNVNMNARPLVTAQTNTSFSGPSFSTLQIPMDLLKRPDPIRWYDQVTLYEDELHDNGVASMTLKVRVMDTCFFCLQRFWLRVDGVLLRIYETRLFHEFGKSFVLREFHAREETFENLKKRGMPITSVSYKDPNVFGNKIALKFAQMEQINIGSDQTQPQQSSATATELTSSRLAEKEPGLTKTT